MNLFRKYFKKITGKLMSHTPETQGRALVVLNIAIVLFTLAYTFLRIRYVNDLIPMWLTHAWGDTMLAPKMYLYLLPLSGLVVLLVAVVLELLLRKYFVRYLNVVLWTFVTLTNILLAYSTFRIIFLASSPFPPLISPLAFSLLLPFVAAFAATFMLLPSFIRFAHDQDIVTNPKLHQHPGMLLQQPTVRGGGSFYAAIFIILAIIFIGLPSKLIGFFVAVFMLGLLGYVDDYQNTHPKSVFRSLENPVLRLLLLFSAVAVLILSGVLITSVGNPIGGVFDLTKFQLTFDHTSVSILIYILTAFWIVWVLNLLSWSNGIDGQYSGIIGIASVFICLLALRFSPLILLHKQVAIMAAISAGVAFGFAKQTWYPSNILWGFGATSAGIVIAALSILINTKILVSVLILLIPFLDAIVSVVRRLLLKQSPLVGDRKHFHHLLLDMGWSVPKIAKFYWLTTFVFGLIGLFASERYLIQTVLIVGGVVAFVIVLANLKSLKKPLA